jgi:hypothetical protein
MGTGPGLACQVSADRVFGRFWNRTDLFLRSQPGPLAGYPDPLLTLALAPIKYLSSDRITTWSIYRLFNFSRSFASGIQISNPTDIR